MSSALKLTTQKPINYLNFTSINSFFDKIECFEKLFQVQYTKTHDRFLCAAKYVNCMEIIKDIDQYRRLFAAGQEQGIFLVHSINRKK